VTKANHLFRAVLKSPILWGSLASTGFYTLVRSEVLTGPLIEEYFASHPVEYAATTLFFVGVAVLILKSFDMLGQYPGLSQPLLGPEPAAGRPVNDCDALLSRLDRLPATRQNDYLVCRLREAIEHVRRRGSAETLDDQLKYLADLDAGRLHGSYALVRVIIWAIPVLGFLGTVIGITLAIANLSPGAVEDSLPLVIKGLSVAFATTTQALVLSIILMFAQYYTDRKESTLLELVDERAAEELDGRFEQIPTGPDGQLVAVRRMAEAMIETTEDLIRRQVELWQAAIDAADQRSARMADSAGKQLQKVLSGAISDALKRHAQQLVVAEQSAIEKGRLHWDQMQQSQARNIQALASLQKSMTGQANMLGRAIEATGDVARLEDTLNRNLAALSGAKNFEQTVMSLAAAIHLLNARLADGPAEVTPVELDPGNRKIQAA